jgi:hypothetical protein
MRRAAPEPPFGLPIGDRPAWLQFVSELPPDAYLAGMNFKRLTSMAPARNPASQYDR